MLKSFLIILKNRLKWLKFIKLIIKNKKMFNKIIKKILVIFLIFISGLSVFAKNEENSKESEIRKACNTKAWENMLHCENFKINLTDGNNFNPWGWKLYNEIRSWEEAANWWPSTENTVNMTLGLIIKNMIIVFWVLSLFVMTIGWGFMIFHAWEDSILTKWKLMLKYWIISLVLALASWVMVNVVNWLLF